MYKVWLIRLIGHDGVPGSCKFYAKERSLPLAPFVGLGVSVDRNSDPTSIESVTVNEQGAIVCWLEDQVYSSDGNICTVAEWPEQLEWHVAGWTCVPSADVLSTPEYSENK